ncbi:MAG TPA: dihydrofolate reductase family protein [Kofleriaceae bacterium]|jgi:dihydrofolate reductase|nr:dihydrofolate reductase family protein [Kofleriaceae bacterium]
MRTLKVFESVSADGYFTGRDGDMTWAYAQSGSPEFQAFVEGNSRGDSTLVFGRVTYEMMASYWPTPLAAQQAPAVAKRMNEAEKLVASRTLTTLGWEHARLLAGDAVAALRTLKQGDGPPLVVLGSGTLVSALVAAGLVDELQLVVKPVAIGGGRPLVEGLAAPLELRLAGSRAFPDGNVVLDWAPRRSVGA